MARPLRIEYKGAFYHVMNRGNARQVVFRDRHDYETFLTLLQGSAELWEIKLHAYSLMPNHYHLLIETPLGNLSRAMRHINGVYTQRYNRHHKRDGHLFRGRYKAILVEDDAYLVELVRYIHQNPVASKLVKEPEAHAWTSHRHYLKDGKAPWLSTDCMLSYFGNKAHLARRKLHEFVMAGVPEPLKKRLDGARLPSVLSSRNFEEWVEWNFVKDLSDRELNYEACHSKQVSEKELRKVVCARLETTWGELTSPTGREGQQKRAMAIWLYRHYLKKSYRELSTVFGVKPARISRIMAIDGLIPEEILEFINAHVKSKK